MCDAASGSQSALPATGNAGKLTMQTMPYVFMPAVAAFFALFL
jgi:hypothetical protein